jgi:hypothetical protein
MTMIVALTLAALAAAASPAPSKPVTKKSHPAAPYAKVAAVAVKSPVVLHVEDQVGNVFDVSGTGVVTGAVFVGEDSDKPQVGEVRQIKASTISTEASLKKLVTSLQDAKVSTVRLRRR